VHQIDAPKGIIVSFSDLAADEALVFAAKNGNEQAFEILVKRDEEMDLFVNNSALPRLRTWVRCCVIAAMTFGRICIDTFGSSPTGVTYAFR
jgi:hypothetical protein